MPCCCRGASIREIISLDYNYEFFVFPNDNYLYHDISNTSDRSYNHFLGRLLSVLAAFIMRLADKEIRVLKVRTRHTVSTSIGVNDWVTFSNGTASEWGQTAHINTSISNSFVGRLLYIVFIGNHCQLQAMFSDETLKVMLQKSTIYY